MDHNLSLQIEEGILLKFEKMDLSFFYFFLPDANNPKNVLVKRLALVVADREDMTLDLDGDLSQLKKQTFTIKEGVQYKIRIEFYIQREIIHGLKYGIKFKDIQFQIKHLFGFDHFDFLQFKRRIEWAFLLIRCLI